MTSEKNEGTFYTGVVEGFYGRPWTVEQRLDLYCCISDMGLNCYLYAPKDDDKHRAVWRELYSDDESDILALLIKESHIRAVEFIYAIAPGLDIVFSNKKDLEALKKKLDQVKSLGCRSFAILFDDIDATLTPNDAKVFSSSADAQVTISNDIYFHLQPQKFLFCPTEYCGSRAVPSVHNSLYLKYIGKNLLSAIDIMWTGPKVVSKSIPVTSIAEVSEVLCRPPVIWDNLLANDYDQRCLFLGPYEGRSIELIPKLKGVLINPNCEYGANFVAIHTLSQWSKCTQKGGKICSLYNPQEALSRAINDWIFLFDSKKRRNEDYLPGKCSDLATFKAIDMEQQQSDFKIEQNGNDMLVEDDCATKHRASSSASSSDMDTTPSHMEGHDSALTYSATNDHKSKPFTVDDLRVIVDYFYLPHSHGDKGRIILEEFTWLKSSAPGSKALKKQFLEDPCTGIDAASNSSDNCSGTLRQELDEQRNDSGISRVPLTESVYDNEQVVLWLDRAANFHCFCEEVNECFNRLTAIPNRPLLYDLYQYMSDAKETTMLLDSYISWLEAGGDEVEPKDELLCRKEGIVGEMLKQLPQVNSAEKLHRQVKPSSIPQSKTFVIRPYHQEDKDSLYVVCLETGDAGNDATLNFPNFPNILGDRYVGPYLALSSDLAFVLEDDIGVCGYVIGVLDSAQFYEDFRAVWLPQMKSNYPVVAEIKQASMEKDMLNEIHNPKLFLPKDLQAEFPSHIHIDIQKRAQGQGNGPRMMKTILSVLKAKGSHGVHLEMAATNTRALKFYFKLGFSVLDFCSETAPDDVLILGRML